MAGGAKKVTRRPSVGGAVPGSKVTAQNRPKMTDKFKSAHNIKAKTGGMVFSVDMSSARDDFKKARAEEEASQKKKVRDPGMRQF
jgi:hypothetical protein